MKAAEIIEIEQFSSELQKMSTGWAPDVSNLMFIPHYFNA